MGFFFRKKKDKTEEIPKEQIQEMSAAEETAVEEPAGKEEECVRTWIDQEAGIAFCGGEREVYLDILHDYCDEGRGYQAKLADCLENQDWKNFAVYVHAVKSSSKTIGSEDFGEEARVLEFAAKEENAELIRERWPEFCVHFEQILAEAGQIIS